MLRHEGERATLTNVSTEHTQDVHPIDRAAKACGGFAALASKIGVSASTPLMWKARGRVPFEYGAPIELATGGEVTRRDLWPNDWQRVWPEMSQATARAA